MANRMEVSIYISMGRYMLYSYVTSIHAMRRKEDIFTLLKNV